MLIRPWQETSMHHSAEKPMSKSTEFGRANKGIVPYKNSIQDNEDEYNVWFKIKEELDFWIIDLKTWAYDHKALISIIVGLAAEEW